MQIEFSLTSFGDSQSTAKRSSPLTPPTILRTLSVGTLHVPVHFPMLEPDPAELQIDPHLKVAVLTFFCIGGPPPPPPIGPGINMSSANNPINNSAMTIPPRMGNCLLPLLFVVDFLPRVSWPRWSCCCLFFSLCGRICYCSCCLCK
jgi:hypothetical protein